MTQVQPAFVVGALRTPTGSKKGLIGHVHPVKLGADLAKEIVTRAGLSDPSVVDELIVGCATQTGKQGFNIAGLVSEIAFGADAEVHGTTINDLCGSSTQATRVAGSLVRDESSGTDVVLVMGVENNHPTKGVFQGQDLMPASQTLSGNLGNLGKLISMKQRVVELSLPKGEVLDSMGVYGDAIARAYGMSRETLDKFALGSQMKASEAMFNGRFKDEIVAVRGPYGFIEEDEGIRPDTTLAGLAKLRPSFGKYGLHTPGSSSQISAGAAGYLVVNEKALKEHSLMPMARIVASAVEKTDSQKQAEHLLGPIKATEKVLNKAGLTVNDIDLWEINEAFASVPKATISEHKIPEELVNVNGGAIALGHALGSSGARLTVTILHEMEKRGVKRGLVTLCIGGGQAIAMIFERV